MKKHRTLGIEKLENKQLLSIAPNDPQIDYQWSLSSLSAYDAWQNSTGSRNVVVAILDSGIDTNHPDLKNNLWTNPGEIANNGIDDEGNGFIDDIHGWNFCNNTSNIQDNYGHGTHVAGIIGAEGGNSIGIVGVNWNVSMMVLKFIDDNGTGWTSALLSSMDYILKMKNEYNIDIVAVNNSWTIGTYGSSVINNYVQQFNSSNILFVAAAGNNGSDNDITPRYPSSYLENNVISVASITSSNALAGSSNYGATSVDLGAPGTLILSTYKNGGYASLSGTSMAAPQVTGAVALLKAIKPSASIGEIKDMLLSTVDQMDGLIGKVLSGGKLNLAAATAKILGIPYSPNVLPMGSLTYINLNSVSGWVKDGNNASINLRLIIDGTQVQTMVSTGNFIFSLGGLAVGGYTIEVVAQDTETGVWVSIGKGSVVIPPPVVKVSYLSLSRISGWAYSERSGASPVVVKVIINGRVVAAQWANLYKSGLPVSIVGANHGFNISLNRSWFRRGPNDIRIQIFDPVSKQTTLSWVGRIRK